TPCELYVKDFFVHESLTYALSPTAELHGQMVHTTMLPNERTRLPMSETLEDLGKDPRGLSAREVPRYLKLLESLFARTGWNPEEFHAFRLKVAYPVCPAWVVTRFPLPTVGAHAAR